MKKVLKLLFLGSLLLLTAIFALYSTYKDTIHKELLDQLNTRINSVSKYPVEVKKISGIGMQGIIFSDISVLSSENRSEKILEIETLRAVIAPLSLIKEKRLTLTLYIDDFKSGRFSGNVEAIATFKKTSEYKNIADPNLLEQINIIDASVESPAFSIDNIFGVININELKVSDIKTRLRFDKENYFITFMPVKNEAASNVLVLRSDHLGFRAAFTMEDGNILCESLRGALDSLHFDLKGIVKHPFSGNIEGAFNGTCESNLKSLTSSGDKTGAFARKCDLRGKLVSNIYLNFTGLSPEAVTIWGTMSLSNIGVNKININEITGKFSFEEGRFDVPLINGSFYDGSISGKLIVDIQEDNIPYTISLNINNVNYSKLLKALGNQEDIYGDLSIELTLQGYAKDLNTVEGAGEVMIAEANLGPMPLLTPLLGDIYSGIEIMFSDADPVSINEAYADFVIKNKKITTNNLTFLGDSIAITSRGHMDFDGDLDFTFENQFLEPSPGRPENWQTGLRNAIVSLGKSIGRARLRGTIEEPKWEFDYGSS